MTHSSSFSALGGQERTNRARSTTRGVQTENGQAPAGDEPGSEIGTSRAPDTSPSTLNHVFDRHAREAPASSPRLLDLFSGAGGAAMGYHRAGWDVVGVDIDPQPRYPFEFYRGDAMRDWLPTILDGAPFFGFQAIHTSPPCQGYSAMSACRPGLADEYPRFIEQLREMLDAIGLPYVIENVEGAPLDNPTMLCGQMFGLELYRHRLFETNFPLTQPEHPKHVVPTSKAGHWVPGTIMSIAGHVSPIAKAREAMGIDWMTRDELAESIPPGFTEYVGSQLMAQIEVAA